MSKSFSQAPKPPQLSAEVISAFERTGAGQDTRVRVPPIVGTREPTNVGGGTDPADTQARNGDRATTNVEMGKTPDEGLGVTTNPAKAERTRRLSIDLPENWHRRFKAACARADKKMIDEVTEFIRRRTLELEQD
jgi:ParG